MVEFRHFSPIIDRLFRFTEMVSLTALLATVLANHNDGNFQVIVFVGTVMATYYLIEPPIEWMAGKIWGPQETYLGRLGAGWIFALSNGITVFAASYVGKLAVLIGATIRSK